MDRIRYCVTDPFPRNKIKNIGKGSSALVPPLSLLNLGQRKETVQLNVPKLHPLSCQSLPQTQLARRNFYLNVREFDARS